MSEQGQWTTETRVEPMEDRHEAVRAAVDALGVLGSAPERQAAAAFLSAYFDVERAKLGQQPASPGPVVLQTPAGPVLDEEEQRALRIVELQLMRAAVPGETTRFRWVDIRGLTRAALESLCGLMARREFAHVTGNLPPLGLGPEDVTQTPASPWRKTTDELPEVGEWVVMRFGCDPFAPLSLGTWNGSAWIIQGETFPASTPAYWMPIPPLPPDGSLMPSDRYYDGRKGK